MSVGLNLVYIIHIFNALENSLEKGTGGALEKIISENADRVKLELYTCNYTESWLKHQYFFKIKCNCLCFLFGTFAKNVDFSKVTTRINTYS